MPAMAVLSLAQKVPLLPGCWWDPEAPSPWAVAGYVPVARTDVGRVRGDCAWVWVQVDL